MLDTCRVNGDFPSRIALLAPMRIELRPLVKRLGLTSSGIGAERIWERSTSRLEVVLALAGVGTDRSAATAEQLIARYRPEHVIVAGVAGAIAQSLRIGDVVSPTHAIDAETGFEYRSTALPPIDGSGGIVTSDVWLEPPVVRDLEQGGVIAVDMETAAVAAVCARLGVPWSAYRGISDRLVEGIVDEAIAGLVGADGRANLGQVARYLAPKPWRAIGLARIARDTGRATRAVADAIALVTGW